MNPSYKNLVKTRLKIMAAMAVFSVIATGTALALRLFVFKDGAFSIDQIVTIMSFFIAAELAAAFRIFQYSRVLKDNSKLEEMEITEYDERRCHIRLNASRMCIWLFIVFLAVACIISLFFCKTVFLTLGITLIVLLVLYAVLKAIYTKTL